MKDTSVTEADLEDDVNAVLLDVKPCMSGAGGMEDSAGELAEFDGADPFAEFTLG